MSRNATTSFHFCIHLYSMYTSKYTYGSDVLHFHLYKRLFCSGSNVAWHELVIRLLRQLTAFQSGSPTELKVTAKVAPKSWTGKLTKVQVCWRHPASRLNFPLENIFASAPAKCDRKSSIELEALAVVGYLNINIPIMESGAGPAAAGKVRGPCSAAHTRLKKNSSLQFLSTPNLHFGKDFLILGNL